jgi:hypothetical protein
VLTVHCDAVFFHQLFARAHHRQTLVNYAEALIHGGSVAGQLAPVYQVFAGLYQRQAPVHEVHPFVFVAGLRSGLGRGADCTAVVATPGVAAPEQNRCESDDDETCINRFHGDARACWSVSEIRGKKHAANAASGGGRARLHAHAVALAHSPVHHGFTPIAIVHPMLHGVHFPAALAPALLHHPTAAVIIPFLPSSSALVVIVHVPIGLVGLV